MSAKNILLIAGVFGALAVILGAFGAHSLKAVLDDKGLETFKLGVSYQYYHVFAMLVVGILKFLVEEKAKVLLKPKGRLLGYAAIAFLFGIIFFSGSLYLLASKQNVIPNAIVGPMTPIGGLSFVVGWVFLALSSFSLKGVK